MTSRNVMSQGGLARMRRVVSVGVAAGGVLGSSVLASTVVGVQSARAVPAKPNGLSAVIATFGQPCNSNAYASVTSFPYSSWTDPNSPNDFVHHKDVHDLVSVARTAYNFDIEAARYGGGMYYCRMKTSNPAEYSTHAWGIAADVNTSLNPQGPTCCWNGTGHNGADHGQTIPTIWQSTDPGSVVNFTWGKSWGDLHHFQYATGY